MVRAGCLRLSRGDRELLLKSGANDHRRTSQQCERVDSGAGIDLWCPHLGRRESGDPKTNKATETSRDINDPPVPAVLFWRSCGVFSPYRPLPGSLGCGVTGTQRAREDSRCKISSANFRLGNTLSISDELSPGVCFPRN